MENVSKNSLGAEQGAPDRLPELRAEADLHPVASWTASVQWGAAYVSSHSLWTTPRVFLKPMNFDYICKENMA